MNFCKMLQQNVHIQDQCKPKLHPGPFKQLALFANVKSRGEEECLSGRKIEPRCVRLALYLEADIPAPLPHHLQLHGLAVASLPQLQPHLVIDVKQVMGVISGVAEHLLGQRSRIAREETSTNSPQEQQCNLSTLWVLKTALAPFAIKDSLTANTIVSTFPASKHDQPGLHS